MGLGNRITLFKDREIDFYKPVMVYRNLNRKGKVYSIKQNGLVVAHTTCLTMSNCEFKVNQSGKKRALETTQRNVHAYIEGKITLRGIMGTTAELAEERNYNLPAKISYYPFDEKGFVCENLSDEPYEVKGAMGVIINKYGVSAAYLI